VNLDFWVRFGGFRNGVENRTKAVFWIFVELKKPGLETETEVLTLDVAWDKVLNSDPVTVYINVKEFLNNQHF
jgi:hypothetical protein